MKREIVGVSCWKAVIWIEVELDYLGSASEA
jgi:hypothetical protein